MGPSSPLLSDRKPVEIIRAQNNLSVNASAESRGSKLVKCVLVGDGQVGKTSLVISYTTNGFPSEYVPTAFDKYHVVVMVDNQPVSVQLCDTAGQDDFDPIRTLCYPDTDVFLLCFSVVNPASFQNIRRKWVPEIRRHWPEAVMLLIGTQADRRADVRIVNQLAANHELPVSEKQARSLAVCIGAKGYVETSALTQRQLKDAFDTAITHALARRRLLNNRAFEKLEARRRWRRLLCCVNPTRD